MDIHGIEGRLVRMEGKQPCPSAFLGVVLSQGYNLYIKHRARHKGRKLLLSPALAAEFNS